MIIHLVGQLREFYQYYAYVESFSVAEVEYRVQQKTEFSHASSAAIHMPKGSLLPMRSYTSF